MKVNVYVDGFNFYYRALKDPRAQDGSTYKWLDLSKLAALLMPKHTIHRIRYFTARVKALPTDPQAPQRQQTYLRALATLPVVTVHFGQFLSSTRSMRLVNPPQVGSRFALVHKTEEKGSDVNLASYLLLDAFKGEYEGAAVITNDSDLAEPIRLVRDELKKPIEVLDPCGGSRVSRELRNVCTFYKPVRTGALAASQFPNPLADANGVFHKPQGW